MAKWGANWPEYMKQLGFNELRAAHHQQPVQPPVINSEQSWSQATKEPRSAPDKGQGQSR